MSVKLIFVVIFKIFIVEVVNIIHFNPVIVFGSAELEFSGRAERFTLSLVHCAAHGPDLVEFKIFEVFISDTH